MPGLHRLGDVRVLMYLSDHPPPHVHVKVSDGRECTVELGDLRVQGRVAVREIRATLAWIEANKGFLWDEWQRNNP